MRLHFSASVYSPNYQFLRGIVEFAPSITGRLCWSSGASWVPFLPPPLTFLGFEPTTRCTTHVFDPLSHDCSLCACQEYEEKFVANLAVYIWGHWNRFIILILSLCLTALAGKLKWFQYTHPNQCCSSVYQSDNLPSFHDTHSIIDPKQYFVYVHMLFAVACHPIMQSWI